ncbi:MAG: cadherin-like beta sandwich domain-containing protein [Spirochaetota bacterium]
MMKKYKIWAYTILFLAVFSRCGLKTEDSLALKGFLPLLETSSNTVENTDTNTNTDTSTNTGSNTDTDTNTNTSTSTVTLSSDNALSNLSSSNGTLYPSFSSATTSYLITLSSSTTSLNLTPTANSSVASITVNGTSVTSGSASAGISLSSGSNSIPVIVTAEDGSTKTYSITANVATDYIVSVTVSGLSGTLAMSNNSDTLSITTDGTYTFASSLANGASYSAAITSKPSSQFCAITSAPNNNLPYGTIASADVSMTVSCNTGYLYNGTIYQTYPIPSIASLSQLSTMAGSYPTKSSGSSDGTGTAASFNNPIDIATDGTYIYVADIFNNAIRKVKIADNTVTNIATVPGAHGVATDGVYVYAASYNTHSIYRVSVNGGTVQQIAGSGSSGNTDAQGTSAEFNTPTYLTTDGTDIFITDRGNNQIRKYSIATGIVSTLVTGLNGPNGIVADTNYLYIANSNSNTILRYDLNAGGAASTFVSSLNRPYGLALDGSNLYVLQAGSRTITKVVISSVTSTNIISSSGYQDGTLGSTAQICNASGNCDSSMTTDGINLYFADRNNHSIRKFSP